MRHVDPRMSMSSDPTDGRPWVTVTESDAEKTSDRISEERNEVVKPGTFWVHAEGDHYVVERHIVLMPGRRDAVLYRDTDHISDPPYVRELGNFRERFRPCTGHEDHKR